MCRPIRAAALLFMLTLASFAQVQKIDNLSFAVPDGWKYEYTPGAEQADMVWTNANGAFCIIVLTKPVTSSGDVEKDFAVTWRMGVEQNPQATLPSPLYDIRIIATGKLYRIPDFTYQRMLKHNAEPTPEGWQEIDEDGLPVEEDLS